MKVLNKTLIALSCFVIFVAGTNTGYDVGDTVADFKLKNVDGKSVALSDFKDKKGVIIVFDCNTCPVSKAYNSRILALNKKYESKGFPVIAINPNDPQKSPGDSFTEMVAQAKKKKYNFPYLIDETQETAKAFGASNTPHAFVLLNDGKAFRVAYIGAIDNNSKDGSSATRKYVEEAVDAILDGKAVGEAKTKAIGCTIKWKNV